MNYGTGKRKTSIARVFLYETDALSHDIKINKKPVVDENVLAFIYHPIKVSQLTQRFRLHITVKGGGFMGQLQAIQHGLSKALSQYQAEVYPLLRKARLMTRDSRVVERKKFGLHKARKRAQYSKR